jgi:hypothetical protein
VKQPHCWTNRSIYRLICWSETWDKWFWGQRRMPKSRWISTVQVNCHFLSKVIIFWYQPNIRRILVFYLINLVNKAGLIKLPCWKKPIKQNNYLIRFEIQWFVWLEFLYYQPFTFSFNYNIFRTSYQWHISSYLSY